MASPKASVKLAASTVPTVLPKTCARELVAATSMDPTSMDPPAWANACPKELSVAFYMAYRGAMACVLSILASSKNRARSWPTCFSAA